MIFDCHSHIAYHRLYPKRYVEPMIANLFEKIRQFNASVKEEQIWTLANSMLNDSDCSKWIKEMDKANISKSVLLILDAGYGLGEPELTLEEIYTLHYEVLKKHRERFIVFAGIDPRRGDRAMSLFKKSIYEYGFRGLKLYPPFGYAMDHPALYSYYEICEKENLPVLIHTGPSNADLQNELAAPNLIENVAKQFSGVNFILAHAGMNIHDENVRRLIDYPNIYLDIAGFQVMLDDQNKLDLFWKSFFECDSRKIMLGIDWPLFNLGISPASQISKLLHNVEKYDNFDPVKLSNLLSNSITQLICN